MYSLLNGRKEVGGSVVLMLFEDEAEWKILKARDFRPFSQPRLGKREASGEFRSSTRGETTVMNFAQDPKQFLNSILNPGFFYLVQAIHILDF